MSATTCPVFRPSLEEFSNFSKYIEKLDEQIGDAGICKVIPPAGWFKQRTPEQLDQVYRQMNIRVPPIQQCVSGLRGVYQLGLIEADKMSAKEFKAMAKKTEPPEDTSYEEMERNFWRSIGPFSPPAYYGADMQGSLFGEDDACGWNLNKLDNMIKILPGNLPGITSAMLYFGMWRAMFAFHTEDMNLYSINYVHTGRPKSWYSIPPKAANRFESMAQSFNPQLYHECSQYLRHKTTMISPKVLKDYGIPFHTIVQLPGEFVITFPASYHAGFNHGFNVAEATNFTTERWIPKGQAAKVCKCQPYSVHINMEHFTTMLEAKRAYDKERSEQLVEKKRAKAFQNMLYSGWLEWQAREAATAKAEAQRMRQEKLKLAAERRALALKQKELEASADRSKRKLDELSVGAVVTLEGDEVWAGDEAWEFRCCCGVHGSSADPLESWPKGNMFQCTGCGSWSHIQCIYNSGKTPEQAFCHVCYELLESIATTIAPPPGRAMVSATLKKAAHRSLRTGKGIQMKSRVLVCRTFRGLVEGVVEGMGDEGDIEARIRYKGMILKGKKGGGRSYEEWIRITSDRFLNEDQVYAALAAKDMTNCLPLVEGRRSMGGLAAAAPVKPVKPPPSTPSAPVNEVAATEAMEARKRARINVDPALAQPGVPLPTAEAAVAHARFMKDCHRAKKVRDCGFRREAFSDWFARREKMATRPGGYFRRYAVARSGPSTPTTPNQCVFAGEWTSDEDEDEEVTLRGRACSGSTMNGGGRCGGGCCVMKRDEGAGVPRERQLGGWAGGGGCCGGVQQCQAQAQQQLTALEQLQQHCIPPRRMSNAGPPSPSSILQFAHAAAHTNGQPSPQPAYSSSYTPYSPSHTSYPPTTYHSPAISYLPTAPCPSLPHATSPPPRPGILQHPMRWPPLPPGYTPAPYPPYMPPQPSPRDASTCVSTYPPPTPPPNSRMDYYHSTTKPAPPSPISVSSSPATVPQSDIPSVKTSRSSSPEASSDSVRLRVAGPSPKLYLPKADVADDLWLMGRPSHPSDWR